MPKPCVVVALVVALGVLPIQATVRADEPPRPNWALTPAEEVALFANVAADKFDRVGLRTPDDPLETSAESLDSSNPPPCGRRKPPRGPFPVEGYFVSADRAFDDSDVALLMRLPKIRELCLVKTKITDKGLAVLAKHPYIAVLSLDKTAVGDAGVKELRSLRSLQLLGLVGTSVTGDGIAALKELPSLQMIDATGTKVSNLELDGGFPALEELGLANCPLRRLSIKHLPKFTGPLMSSPDEGVTFELQDLPMVECVRLVVAPQEHGHRIFSIQRLPRLKELCLSGIVRNPSLLDIDAENLRFLALGLVMPPNGLPDLGNFPRLETLGLGVEGPVTSEGFGFLTKLTHLKTIALRDVTVSLPQLAKLRELEEIRLNFSPNFDTLLHDVKTLRQLKRLRLTAIGTLSDDALKSLLSMPWLESLEITTQMTEEQERALRSGLPNTKITVTNQYSRAHTRSGDSRASREDSVSRPTPTGSSAEKPGTDCNAKRSND